MTDREEDIIDAVCKYVDNKFEVYNEEAQDYFKSEWKTLTMKDLFYHQCYLIN
jgi:hypothetical protein